MQANPNLSTTPPLPGVVAVPALNNALQTIATDFSGDTDPAALAWPFSKWADTSTGLLKRRNAAGTEWVVEGSLFRRALNMIPSDEIPTSDIGLIATPSQGLMEWDGTRYTATNGAHGQCRFVFVSTTECRLMPHNGNGLIINGRQFRIPEAGVPITNAGTAGNGRYFVFAKDGGVGGMALELASTSGASYSAHTDGVVIKTGDPARTLVGWLGTTGGNTFQDSVNGGRLVASWFNRRRRSVVEQLAGSLGSSTLVGLGNGRTLFNWAGEEVSGMISGYCATTGPGVYYEVQVRRGGATPPFVPGVAAGRSDPGPAAVSSTVSDLVSEGAAIYQLWGLVNAYTVNLGLRFECSTNM